MLAVLGHLSPGVLGHGGDSALLQVQRCGGVGKRTVRSYVVSDKPSDEDQQYHQHPGPREPLRAYFHL